MSGSNEFDATPMRLASEGGADDAILDAIYGEGLAGDGQCLIYFGSKHYPTDYVPLPVSQERRFLSYEDENGSHRYAICDAVMRTADGSATLAYGQAPDGTAGLYAEGEDGTWELVVEITGIEDRCVPLVAWLRGDGVTMAMCSNARGERPALGSGPVTGEGGGRASGSLSVWRVALDGGMPSVTQPTAPMADWCVSVIPNADDGRPGLLVANMRSPRRGPGGDEPSSFLDLLEDIEGEAGECEVEMPLGVSVYDPSTGLVERISLDGHVGWGIGSVELMGEDELPVEVREAGSDETGAGVILYDS